MKKAVFLLLLLIAGLILMPAASAVDLSFVDRSVVGTQGFIIHEIKPDGSVSFFARLNSTAEVTTLDANNSYVLELYTEKTDYLKNPALLVMDPMDYINDNFPKLILGAFVLMLIGLAIAIARRA